MTLNDFTLLAHAEVDQMQGLVAYIEREDDMVTTARVQWRCVI